LNGPRRGAKAIPFATVVKKVMAIRFRGAVFLALVLGAILGLGGYTFVYARGYSYLTNDPAACANCHVMQEYYSGWMKSAHHAVASCNDCHTPHDLVGKYTTKALNGFSHSLAFTVGPIPDNILVKARSERVTEGACRSCHAALTEAIDGPHSQQDISCIRCHADVGHSAAALVPGSTVSVISSTTK
jgi:cytochrome c nitrite reductase small subunit